MYIQHLPEVRSKDGSRTQRRELLNTSSLFHRSLYVTAAYACDSVPRRQRVAHVHPRRFRDDTVSSHYIRAELDVSLEPQTSRTLLVASSRGHITYAMKAQNKQGCKKDQRALHSVIDIKRADYLVDSPPKYVPVCAWFRL